MATPVNPAEPNRMLDGLFANFQFAIEYIASGLVVGVFPVLISSCFISLIFWLVSGKAATPSGRKRKVFANWLVFMFASFGAMLGVATGSSRSPMVGNILPAIITLSAGYIGYIFVKQKSSRFISFIPAVITSLSFSASFGFFYGSALRGKSERYDKYMTLIYDEYQKSEAALREINKLKIQNLEIDINKKVFEKQLGLSAGHPDGLPEKPK